MFLKFITRLEHTEGIPFLSKAMSAIHGKFSSHIILTMFIYSELSDAKSRNVIKGFAIFITFKRFLPGMNFLMPGKMRILTSQKGQPVCTSLAQFHFKILSALTYQDALYICSLRL